MPTAPLPFVNAQQSGDEELAGASPQALNVTVDGAGAVRRRPGIARYFTGDTALPAGEVIGLHATETGDVFAVHTPFAGSFAQSFYRVAEGGTVLLGSRVGSARPVFTETEMLLVVAAGQAMSKIELASPTSVGSLGGGPPVASHVIHNSLRLLANDLTIDRTKIRYSDQAAGTTTYAGHEMWTVGVGTAGYFTAEAAPDPIVALGENTNEVWAFGSRTLQIFVPDTSLVFAPATTMEVGCGAAYSVVKKEDSFLWLDHARRFVSSAGRGIEVLSTGLQAVIQGFSRVDDCYGYRVLLGPVDGVAWTFPTEGRTFFVQDGAGWSEWTSWSSKHQPFAVTAHAYDRVTARNFVGGATGVALLDGHAASDITADGTQPIVASVTTGFINRDTDARKHCKRVRLSFRRTGSSSTTEARGFITYRDSLGAWEPPIPVVVDGADPVCEISSLGTYRRRQWRYSFSDEVEELVLVGAEEVFEVTD
jgi:hypothetical protein